MGAGRAGAAHLRRIDDHREEEEAPKGDQLARGSNPGRAVPFDGCLAWQSHDRI